MSKCCEFGAATDSLYSRNPLCSNDDRSASLNCIGFPWETIIYMPLTMNSVEVGGIYSAPCENRIKSDGSRSCAWVVRPIKFHPDRLPRLPLKTLWSSHEQIMCTKLTSGADPSASTNSPSRMRHNAQSTLENGSHSFIHSFL